MSGDAEVEELIAECIRNGARGVAASGQALGIDFSAGDYRIRIRESLLSEALDDYGLRQAQRLLRDAHLAPQGAASGIEIAVVSCPYRLTITFGD